MLIIWMGETMASIGDVLAEGIDNWIAARSSRNLSLLARNSGLSYATVRRIASKETGASAEVAAALCNVLFTKQNALKVIKEHFPSLGSLIFNEINNAPSPDEYLQSFYSSEQHFPILLLAQSKGGVDRELVTTYLGIRYVCYFDELIEAGVLKKEGDRFFFREQIENPSKETVRMHLKVILELARKDNDAIPGASDAYTFSAQLKPEAVREINEMLAKFHKELLEYISDENNFGEVYWLGGWIHNILINEDDLK